MEQEAHHETCSAFGARGGAGGQRRLHAETSGADASWSKPRGSTAAIHGAIARAVEAEQSGHDGNRRGHGGRGRRTSRVTPSQPSIGNTHDLQLVLEALTYQIELKRLDGFKARFEEYRRLNEDTLLARPREHQRAELQRLSFGPSVEAADAFHRAIDAAVRQAPEPVGCAAGEQGARAWASVLEIRALYPRHIAEAEDAEMIRMEAAMAGAAAGARAALERAGPSAAGFPLARGSTDRAGSLHGRPRRDLDLSRRNSNVRALALAIGRKRTVAADAEAQLMAVEEGLEHHELRATR